ncbi:MAG: porin [Holophaga sp.]|nr:porin [Holophaga sp.]
MKTSLIPTLAAILVAGGIQAQAQDVDLKAELARQNARIAELEKKAVAAPAPSAGPLQFPPELTPYILIDLSVVSTTNNTADGKTKLDMGKPWYSADRWGLRGTLNTYTDSLKAIYKLEGEFLASDGSLGSTTSTTKASTTGNGTTYSTTATTSSAAVLFNRDAWVGLYSSTYGQFTFGRQNTLARDFSEIYCDPYGTTKVGYEETGYTNANNFKDLVNFAGSVDGSRMNKGMVWKKVLDNGISMGLAYNFSYYSLNTALNSTAGAVTKAAEANTSTRDTTGCVALGYNGSTFDLSGYYTQANNAGYTQKSYSLGGNYQITPQFRVNAGFYRFMAEQGNLNPEQGDTAYTVSASYAASNRWTYALGRQAIKMSDAALSSGFMATNPFATTGSTSHLAASAIGSGLKTTTYGSAMVALGKRVDAYGTADYMRLSRAYTLASTNGHDSQVEIAIGLRIKAL